MKTLHVYFFATFIASIAGISAAGAQSNYVITEIGRDAIPNALNANGQVTGRITIPKNGRIPAYTTAFIWSRSAGLTPLGKLPGGTYSIGNSINGHGTVAGYADVPVSGNSWRAIVWSPSGGMRNLNDVTGADGKKAADHGWLLHTASAINDANQIVGYGSRIGQTGSFDYLWELDGAGNVKIQEVPLGYQEEDARAINNAGQIAGSVPHDVVINSQGQIWQYPKAGVWTPGTPAAVTFGFFGGYESHAFGINNTPVPDVVGYANTAAGNPNAFHLRDSNGNGLWDASEMVNLGTLGGTSSTAFGVNDLSWVVGSSTNSSGVQRAFVYGSAGMRDLNTISNTGSTWSLSMALGINNSGLIIATGTYKVKNTLQNRAVLLSPN